MPAAARALTRPRRSQKAHIKAPIAITPSGTPTPAPIAVSREEDELDPELDPESEELDELVELEELVLVELTASPATPGIAVPYGTETDFIGQVTVPLS